MSMCLGVRGSIGCNLRALGVAPSSAQSMGLGSFLGLGFISLCWVWPSSLVLVVPSCFIAHSPGQCDAVLLKKLYPFKKKQERKCWGYLFEPGWLYLFEPVAVFFRGLTGHRMCVPLPVCERERERKVRACVAPHLLQRCSQELSSLAC